MIEKPVYLNEKVRRLLSEITLPDGKIRTRNYIEFEVNKEVFCDLFGISNSLALNFIST